MMNEEPKFKEGRLNTDVWSHFKYHFKYLDSSDFNIDKETEIYNWCLFNIETILGWHVLWDGVVIFKEEDAMAFKLRWM